MERWVCKFCNLSQIINAESKQTDTGEISINGVRPSKPFYVTAAYGCTNPDCRQLSFSISLLHREDSRFGSIRKLILSKQLLPKSTSKPQPDHIPSALRQDYEEACAIRELSPKAAATLVRRCLQGMIRDFCNIANEKTLYGEIQKLKTLIADGSAPSGVSAESVDAIDQVRGIGNIGAHMEKDIDLIVDVDPDEAQVLIELVEMLFDEWYVARHERQARLAKIKVIAAAKSEVKKQSSPPTS